MATFWQQKNWVTQKSYNYEVLKQICTTRKYKKMWKYFKPRPWRWTYCRIRTCCYNHRVISIISWITKILILGKWFHFPSFLIISIFLMIIYKGHNFLFLISYSNKIGKSFTNIYLLSERVYWYNSYAFRYTSLCCV